MSYICILIQFHRQQNCLILYYNGIDFLLQIPFYYPLNATTPQ